MGEKFTLMKNPYLKSLLAFLHKGDKVGVPSGTNIFLEEPNINVFDKIAYLYRFYNFRLLD
jgi:hypothetical protein